MCGRSACYRDRNEIQCACAYRRKGGARRVVKPAWVPSPQQYYPSYNVCPQTNTPVLISGSHSHVKATLSNESSSPPPQDDEVTCRDRVLQVMKWGLVPSWHKGDSPSSFPALLNNCRYEGILDKPSFRNAIHKRQRCVVLADGFFEWKRASKKSKQPYYVYFSDDSPTEETLELTNLESDSAEDKEKTGHRLLTMAGFFDIWTPTDSKAILEDDDAVSQWLDPDLPTAQVLKMISPVGSEAVTWHPVSTLVNNVKNKTQENVVKIELQQAPRGRGTLHAFFSGSKAKTSSGTDGVKKEEQAVEPCTKKPKLE